MLGLELVRDCVPFSQLQFNMGKYLCLSLSRRVRRARVRGKISEYTISRSSVKILEENDSEKGSIFLSLKIEGSLFYMNVEKIKKELNIILNESLTPR